MRIDSNVFDATKKFVLEDVGDFDLKADDSFIVPNGVQAIGWYTFRNCCDIKSITIPDTVTTIYLGAFAGCCKLKSKPNNYKAFSLTKTGKLICRDKIYTVGKKSMARGELNPCFNGIHYCTNIFDIFNYYCGDYGEDFVIGICDVSDENIGGKPDSKRCARWVRPTKILTREEVIGIMNGAKTNEEYKDDN